MKESIQANTRENLSINKTIISQAHLLSSQNASYLKRLDLH
jgi:hypothetical protein